MSFDEIPMVDFGACGVEILSCSNREEYGDGVLAIAEKVGAAFKEYGFVYLKSHGVAQSLVSLWS
jgi:isopenicillin N synthase-like dioxygenase